MSDRCLKIQAFDHLTLVVADLEASRRFYIDLLGMQHAERPPFDFQGAWLKIGPVFLHLILANEASGRPGPGEQGTKRPSRGLHFAFQLADANAAVATLQKVGVEIVDGPKFRPDGAVQVFVRDPDGYLVELTSGG